MPEDKPKEWNPSMPLEGDDEEEAQRRARARARVDYLTEDLKKKASEKKGKKGIFD
jgi:hypothetical protein